MNYINEGKRDILIIPKFNNIHKIQMIREKYDELFDKIEPHITLAFPFRSNISNEELKRQLLNITKDISPFKIKCKGVTLRKDNRINTYYIFLNIQEGKEVINMTNVIYHSKTDRQLQGKLICHFYETSGLQFVTGGGAYTPYLIVI